MKENHIFSGFGIEIFERSGKFYIRYDSGEIAVKIEEIEVTEEEAIKAQLSEHNAYRVILAKQKK